MNTSNEGHLAEGASGVYHGFMKRREPAGSR